MFENIKLVVFDLDGTIVKLDVDWERLREELRKYFRNHYNFDSNFNPLDEGIDGVWDELGDSAVKEAYGIVERYEVENIENVSLIRGSLELIRHLKDGGQTLAIFSSNTQRTIELALGYLRIREYFDIIVGKKDVSKHKPDPEGLIVIKNKAGIELDEMCFIGDKETDFQCAARLNVRAVPIEAALRFICLNR